MKIVIAGGTGQVGTILAREFGKRRDEVVILSRHTIAGSPFKVVGWNGKDPGAWSREIDGADIVINLAGRSVNCRYNADNRRQIMDSRVDSTLAVGRAIEEAKLPPRVWLQSSTATIYSHGIDAPNDDVDGVIGGNEPDVPETWRFSIDVARTWETAANSFDLPHTRTVLMRSAMTMSPDRNGIFDVMLGLVRKGLGGTAGDGRQFISWIHDRDFVRAVDFLIERGDLSGPVNISAPNPLSNREFMKIFRETWGTGVGLPATKFMLEIGAVFLETETELILKSRRVVPRRLLESGFEFEFSEWRDACRDLCERWNR